MSDADIFDGLRIIDCDSHLTEPSDLWTSRAPASLQGRVPVLKTVDGYTDWYMDDELWATTQGNTIEVGGKKIRGVTSLEPFARVDPASWAVKERLELLDEMGIYAQILYPNSIGFSSNHIFAIEDPSLRASVLTIYNDFLIEVQEESTERLFPQPILPIWDMQFTLREMERLLNKGMRGFTVTDRPEAIGLPEPPDAYFDPMWDLVNESGAVVSFHVASGSRKAERLATVMVRRGRGAPQDITGPSQVASRAWSSFAGGRRVAVEASQSFMSNMRILTNLCMSNLFDRFPKLKVVSAESGIGWIPFFLETLEYQFDEMIAPGSDAAAFAKRRPTEYFRDHISVMFWFEQSAPQLLLEEIGINNVLIETDIPHPTCLYPGTLEHFSKVLADVSPDVRRRVLQDNAAALYRIPIPGSRG